MATYWIENVEFRNKVKPKMGTGETSMVLLMDESDKQWWKAEVRPIESPKQGADTLKILADFGEPTDEEYYIEVLNREVPEED